MGARLRHLHTDPMKVKQGVKMLTRLIESGFLASQNVEGNTTWTLAERQTLVLETDISVSICNSASDFDRYCCGLANTSNARISR